MKFLPLLVLAVTTLSAHAAPPVVSNVRASQRAGTHTVDIYYNVTSANSPLTVYVAISADAGTTWNVPVFTVQGAVGPGVTPGSDRHIQWNVGTDWPVQTVNWYDAVKWCNARSEKAGLTPCYYTSAGQTTVYRTSQITLSNSFVKWTASGYRLPTEAEWEKAARGGRAGLHYPWGNSISCTNANYDFCAGNTTTPVGSYAPNGYGLYDMAGNVWQWCWDSYDGNWYGNYQATMDDTRGPASGSSRLLRGGVWCYDTDGLRCAFRFGYASSNANNNIGFHCVRGALVFSLLPFNPFEWCEA